jgi:hypothetical protein
MWSSSSAFLAFIQSRSQSRSLLVFVLGFAMVPTGCYRSRMLNPPKARPCPPGSASCNPTTHDDAAVDRDALADGKDGDKSGDGRSADGLNGGNADTPRDGGNGGNADTPRDGQRNSNADAADGLTSDLPSESRSDGSRDGTFDGVADSLRDGRLDGPSDRRSDVVVCGTIEICGNGLDDDCNGLTDCSDRACQSDPACIDRKKEVCDNGKDDDGNGLVDCKDPACFGDKACVVPGHEICNNNLDDDDDGLIDCKDPDCAKDPSCVVKPGNEICDNGKDDNGDGLTDCSDPQCKTFPACLQSACVPDVDFGAIASSGTSVTKTISTVGATASYSTCAPPGGVARVAGFSLAAAADVKIDFTQAAGSAHVLALFRAGVGQTCDQNPVDCLRVGDKATATQTYTALPPGNYWLAVQSFAGTTGSTTVTLSTGKAGVTEICDNGIDDDGDGAIDCADLDCASAPTCNLCVPEVNLGAIVVGDGSKTTTIDTSTGSNRYHPTCAGKSTGKDIVIRFSVKETVGLTLDWQQSGDHVYGLYHLPAPGASCDATEGGCTDMGGLSYGETNWSYFDPGDYLLIFKARAAGMEGKIWVSLTAFANRGVEICDNGIDDDGDRLVDCDDPDCFGVAVCAAPMCTPDGDLGNIDIGTKTTVHVDLTSATQVYRTDCGKGDGRGRAYKVNLLQAMELDFTCTQTGDQVLQLSSQLGPLDLCDAHIQTCADPAVLPSGCNFGLPSLQPGSYYILVQAFSAGSEGTVDLTLRGVSQRVLEICNNGIDDDGDGAIDCNDRKCATDPSCRALRCRPDKQLGLIAIDGSTASATVQTSGAGNDQTNSSCVSGPGGADAVVGFTLPGKTDLTIAWAQVGNHALVLYQGDNAQVPCEANALIDCKATSNASTGSYMLKALAAGTYYLVVDADKAGSEGGVILQLSGLPAQ